MSDRSPQATSRAGQSATAEILALEHELEHERMQAAVALERVQQQLEDIEAAEPGGPHVTSASDTAEVVLAGDDSPSKLRQRERELLAERDEAVSSLRAALVALERAEAGVPQSEERRLEIEEQIRAETEQSVRAELEADHKLFAAEAAERARSELSLREQTLQLEREASARAAEESDARLEAIEDSFDAAVQRVEAAEARVAGHAEEATRRLIERERELRSEARGLAAAWLRGQVESISRDAERAAEERLLAERRLREDERSDRANRFTKMEEKAKALERRASSIALPLAEPGEAIDLNAASFEQLRGLGMSVTQSTRVIAYRERAGGFGDVDDLDSVPGFTEEMLAGLKPRLIA